MVSEGTSAEPRHRPTTVCFVRHLVKSKFGASELRVPPIIDSDRLQSGRLMLVLAEVELIASYKFLTQGCVQSFQGMVELKACWLALVKLAYLQTFYPDPF